MIAITPTIIPPTMKYIFHFFMHISFSMFVAFFSNYLAKSNHLRDKIHLISSALSSSYVIVYLFVISFFIPVFSYPSSISTSFCAFLTLSTFLTSEYVCINSYIFFFRILSNFGSYYFPLIYAFIFSTMPNACLYG